MTATEPRIDAYIEKSADFARPILTHIRKLVHKACPNVQEKIKWGMPHFDYKNAMLCSMAAFKAHCTFGFWKASIMKDPEALFNKDGKNAMGQFDRITSIKDLPGDKVLTAYIKEAAALNDANIKVPKPKIKSTAPEPPVPPVLELAFKRNKKASAVFKGFSPSHRREYIEWINEAKTDPTKEKRANATIEWLTEGKSLNWKYNK